ncbi:hypothetical protein [Acetobacter sp.]|uniref:hypothetical protein n=1 Tax=Acetobacter sp. TaxID=440 RepID=UPI0039E7A936
MYNSQTIEVDGTFVGTIILDAEHRPQRFYAAHDSVRPLHDRILSERDDFLREVMRQFRSGQDQATPHASALWQS